MRKSIITLVAAGSMIGFLCTGCETSSAKLAQNNDTKVEAAQQALKFARANYLAEWRKFKSATDQEIALNEKKIDVIKDIMVNIGPRAIQKYRTDMHGLQRMNRELAKSLTEYTYEGHVTQVDPSRKLTMD